MKKKLLIASIITSGLTYAQSNSDKIYSHIFDRNKTKECKINSCLILIVNKDTICWNHSEKAREIIKKEVKERGCFNHYQYERPEGSPYTN